MLDQAADGFYKAQVWVGGIRTHTEKTFCPQHWTREQVVRCIMETYQDCLQQKIAPMLLVNGTYSLEGKVANGPLLYFYLDKKMNIKTVYPYISRTKKDVLKVNKKTRR